MFMEEAIKLAEQNAANNFTEGGPFGAVVVKDSVIVGRGKNNVLLFNDPTAHAEMCAIRDASRNMKTYDLTGCELYSSCMPCPMCLSAIIWANIKTVYYGNTQDDADEIGFRDDDIYDELNEIHNKKEHKMIRLINKDRNMTIETFRKFRSQKKK